MEREKKKRKKRKEVPEKLIAVASGESPLSSS